MSVYRSTEFNTCNAFFGIGKKSAYKVMMQKAENFQMLSELGSGRLQKLTELHELNL